MGIPLACLHVHSHPQRSHPQRCTLLASCGERKVFLEAEDEHHVRTGTFHVLCKWFIQEAELPSGAGESRVPPIACGAVASRQGMARYDRCLHMRSNQEGYQVSDR